MQRRLSGQPIFGSMDLGPRLRSSPVKAHCGSARQTPGKLSVPGVGLARMVPTGYVLKERREAAPPPGRLEYCSFLCLAGS